MILKYGEKVSKWKKYFEKYEGIREWLCNKNNRDDVNSHAILILYSIILIVLFIPFLISRTIQLF